MISQLEKRATNGIYDTDEAHAELQDGRGVAGPETDQDLMGSDLYIAPAKSIAEANRAKLAELRDQDPSALKIADIDYWLVRQVAYIQDMYSKEFEELTEEDKTLARSLQKLVVDELRDREQARGFRYQQGSRESYLENADTIEQLMIELSEERDQLGQLGLNDQEFDSYDAEAEHTVRYLLVWRNEMLAELDAKDLQSLLKLAS